MTGYALRRRSRKLSNDNFNFKRVAFKKFYTDCCEDDGGCVLKAKRPFKYGEKLMDLNGIYIVEPLEAVKILEKCQEFPRLHRTKFFIKTNESFFCCDLEKSRNDPSYYLLHRRTTGYNCKPTIYYAKEDKNKLNPKISIEATKFIKKHDPIIVYYGVLWFLNIK
uniref:SET domain-containing protein n=1 Tax=Strongyloides venezuelensis TaxID=75913 RepID=A0A0K0G3T4_STRVS